MCASTPLVELLSGLPKNTPILAIGAARFTKRFFEQHGFTDVIYPNEFYQQYPEFCPQYRFCRTAPAPGPASHYKDKPVEYLVFHADSTDWYADIQLAVDCLVNYGQLNPKIKGDERHTVKVLCTNPDITYADNHLLPRFTVGAIVTAV